MRTQIALRQPLSRRETARMDPRARTPYAPHPAGELVTVAEYRAVPGAPAPNAALRG